MRRRRSMTVRVDVPVVVTVVVGSRVIHQEMLYYNITGVHLDPRAYGFPIAMAMAAATNGNGTDTVARNQTNRAGMNGISHSNTR
jgi:hypothetical protein